MVPYLSADESLVERWRTRLAAVKGFKVAIAWQGSRAYREDRWRSIPLEAFAPLAEVDGVRLISVQHGDGVQQLAEVADRFSVLSFDSLDTESGPFLDTAAILRNVDLLVSSDSAVSHLAGALAVRTWMPLPFRCDWRWFREREDSPWYPTLRLFRQSTWHHWPDVFARIADELRLLVRSS